MKFKITKTKIIASVVIAVLLMITFWYGGNAPGLQGFEAEPPLIEAFEEDDDKSVVSDSISEDIDIDVDEVEEEVAVDEVVDQLIDEPDDIKMVPGTPDIRLLEEIEPPKATKAIKDKPAVKVAEKPKEEPEKPAINAETDKAQDQTPPVPEDTPVAVEPEKTEISDAAYTATLSVRSDTILNNLDRLNPEKIDLVPKDGIILPPTEVIFYEGESVFNVLQREMKKAKIHMEFTNTPIYNSAYIEGINNLYALDCGELSGWEYRVNGWFPNYGSSRYQLEDGDVIEWLYTCDLGADIGGHNFMRK